MPYHLNLTLEQRATLSAAIAIWNKQEVKDKISKWADNWQRSGLVKIKNEGWEQLIKEVIEETNQIVGLHSQFKDELIHVVKSLGEKIYNWYLYIWYEYYYIYGEKIDVIDYIHEIYWTPFGTIDEVRILQSYWMTNPNLKVAVIYNVACKNALEEDINDLWQRMPNSMKDCCSIFHNPGRCIGPFCNTHYDHVILAYWKCRRDGRIDHSRRCTVPNHLSRNERRGARYKLNYSVEHNMFLLSVYNGYSTAVKYFWNKLTQEEKDSSLLYSAWMTVFYYSTACSWGEASSCIQEKYIEILIFLINQMIMDEKESFLRKQSIPDDINNCNIDMTDLKEMIFSMLLSFWPWQELFMPVLNNILQYPEHNQQAFLEALLEISRGMFRPKYGGENNNFQKMLHTVWHMIPGSIKQTIIEEGPGYHLSFNFVVNLLRGKNLDGIKMIFNDPEITDVRMEYIEFGQKGYESLIIRGEYELLDQFMEEVLRSEEEKRFLKSIINHIDVCQNLVRAKKYDSVDRFLNWKFETVEERKQCKEHLTNYQFFLNWVFGILKSCDESVYQAKEDISGFLEWILGSEEDIASYKEEFIVNSEPLIGKEVTHKMILCRLSEDEAQKIRQILA